MIIQSHSDSKVTTFNQCAHFVVSLLLTGSASLVQLLTVQFCFSYFIIFVSHLCLEVSVIVLEVKER